MDDVLPQPHQLSCVRSVKDTLVASCGQVEFSAPPSRVLWLMRLCVLDVNTAIATSFLFFIASEKQVVQ
ncbi:hypothetical protein EYF80_047538 [Liparis tanakae]|uniref:Uncharacterized protein n=1 Tax=Liparis tanakae TaxID=230148 RepID=A0A4Z2FN81_9TELE|nr:hypothetical protein EYF80_047538 [Liparis tanakae]